KYALLSHMRNLRGTARRNLKLLLSANKRLNTAYVLKESFGQLWDYRREAWARKFFENWRRQLKWQRLNPYEKFAEMIDRHWDGIAAYWQAREQSRARLRRRIQQQDPGHSTSRIWAA
ncbi:MAG: transposase, partial [Steroidobacteraceae bacterium]